ncbi:hypothetical protein D3C84_764830 [compost metagenome]
MVGVQVFFCVGIVVLLVQAHRMRLDAKRAQQQSCAAIEQPGQGLEQLERRFEQAVAQGDEGVRIAPGQLPWQVFGQHQQYDSGAQPGQPETVFTAVALTQQTGQGQHQQFAQGRAEHQGLWRDCQFRVFVGQAVAPGAIELLLGGVHRSEQRRPEQGQYQYAKQGS